MGSFGVAFLGGEVTLAEGECQQRQSYFSDSLCESNKIQGEHWEFYTWASWQMPNRAAGSTPAQKHSGWLWSHWLRRSWSYFPSFRPLGTKACYSLWYCVSERKKHEWCKLPAQKVMCGPWEDKPEPLNKIPSSHFHIQMVVMKQGNMMCLSLSAKTKPCCWSMLIPSCLNPNSSWVHYSSCGSPENQIFLQMSDFAERSEKCSRA